MALTQFTTDISYIAALPDSPTPNGGFSKAQLKSEFDKAGNALKTFINDTMITEIESELASKSNSSEHYNKNDLNSTVDGSSGADKIGVTSIDGLSGTTAQIVLESIGESLADIVFNIKNEKLAPEANYTQAFARAITKLGAVGGTIYIPPGEYYADKIRLTSNIRLLGSGASSLLRQTYNFAEDFIALADYNQIHCKIESIKIKGYREETPNAIPSNIIYLDNNDVAIDGEVDHYHVIKDCVIEESDGYGIRIVKSRGLVVDNCWVRKCKKDGISVSASDNVITNCNISLCVNGISTIDGGSALRISNCKAFFNTIGMNFAPYTQNIMLSNCETQSNELHGYYLENVLNASLIGLIADSDSRINATGCGFYIKNCEHVKLTGVFREKFDGTLLSAVKFEGVNKHVNVDITYDHDASHVSSTAAKFVSAENYADSTNYVKVNGVELYNNKMTDWTTSTSAGVTSSSVTTLGETKFLNIITQNGTQFNALKINSPKYTIKANDSIGFSCILKTKDFHIDGKAELILYNASDVALDSKSVTFTSSAENEVYWAHYVNTFGAVKVGVILQCYVRDANASLVGGVEIKNPQLVIMRS